MYICRYQRDWKCHFSYLTFRPLCPIAFRHHILLFTGGVRLQLQPPVSQEEFSLLIHMCQIAFQKVSTIFIDWQFKILVVFMKKQRALKTCFDFKLNLYKVNFI